MDLACHNITCQLSSFPFISLPHLLFFKMLKENELFWINLIKQM